MCDESTSRYRTQVVAIVTMAMGLLFTVCGGLLPAILWLQDVLGLGPGAAWPLHGAWLFGTVGLGLALLGLSWWIRRGSRLSLVFTQLAGVVLFVWLAAITLQLRQSGPLGQLAEAGPGGRAAAAVAVAGSILLGALLGGMLVFLARAAASPRAPMPR